MAIADAAALLHPRAAERPRRAGPAAGLGRIRRACDAGGVSAASVARARVAHAARAPVPRAEALVAAGGCWRGGPPPPRPDGGWPPARGLRRCRGQRGGALFCIEVVCRACRSLPRSSVADVPATSSRRWRAPAAARARGGEPPRRRRLQGQRRPRWAAPLAAFVGTRCSETSQRRVPRKSRCGGKRAPHAAPASATAAAAAAVTARPCRREGRRLRARRAAWCRERSRAHLGTALAPHSRCPARGASAGSPSRKLRGDQFYTRACPGDQRNSLLYS